MQKEKKSFSRKVISLVTSSLLVTAVAGVSIALASITFDNTSIVGDSSFNAITGVASTTIDLGANKTLSLQTTANGPITSGTGLFTIGGILNVTNIDRSGVISIGTSTATSINIGRSTQTVTFPGSIIVTGTSTVTGVSDITNIDRSGVISIGTSTATTMTVGRSGQNVIFPGNASSTGTFSIGATGKPISGHLSATSSITFGVIASSTCQTATVTVTGANAGDTTVATPTPVSNGIDTASTTWNGWVSSSGTVTVRACNPTGSNTVSIAAQTWRADVWQH